MEEGSTSEPEFDVVVVGAGMAGLYLLYRLRQLGLRAQGLEAADDVGGTWYWNRYPGARCDVESIDYSYSFDPELEDEWQWSERYATQPEILRYLEFVADKHDLRRDIRFSTRVAGARWDDDASLWRIRTDDGDALTCRHYVMATGCLSAPKDPDIEGAGAFEGPVYFTSRWPHDGVDFTGMRVGVIGTGSSGIQSIPIIADQARELTVFQRTPNFSIPARNGLPLPHKLAQFEGRRREYRQEAKRSPAGVPAELPTESALAVSDDARQQRFQQAWDEGTIFAMLRSYTDVLVDPAANDMAAEFVRDKIRALVDDPETAEALCPKTFPIGTKRLCLDTDYFATFNQPHVRLVDLRRDPIASITATGVDTESESFDLDALVFATGFDAMTGAIVAVDIEGRDGRQLREHWRDGPHTYLGLMSAGFPNLFMITGPQSPSVLSNMAVSIEQHVDWVCDTIDHLRSEGSSTIEPTPAAEAGWVQHTNDYADITLMSRANSWYMGANVPGKPRVILPYVGGVDRYRTTCDEVVEHDYLGFTRVGTGAPITNDGVIRRVQPDVAIMLETMQQLGVPPLAALPVADARALMEAMAAEGPSGPDVGEVLDGTLPGADGELAYRLFRPSTPGPHPLVVYFHGGGWVLGSAVSDEPFCRELCLGADAVVVSVDYRHAPEHPFPAAPDDALAAVRWIADHAGDLGTIEGRLLLAGWSAGANLATVTCQRVRDEGGPIIAGQVLIAPVVDHDFSRSSYVENGVGFVLEADTMRWFWDHYADPGDREHPHVSPLRTASLADLPPALVVTAEFDPLRDEGDAYADALRAAGVEVTHWQARGQIHTSLLATGMMLSSAALRADIASEVQAMGGASVPA